MRDTEVTSNLMMHPQVGLLLDMFLSLVSDYDLMIAKEHARSHLWWLPDEVRMLKLT
jgi:hypothetical protein